MTELRPCHTFIRQTGRGLLPTALPGWVEPTFHLSADPKLTPRLRTTVSSALRTQTRPFLHSTNIEQDLNMSQAQGGGCGGNSPGFFLAVVSSYRRQSTDSARKFQRHSSSASSPSGLVFEAVTSCHTPGSVGVQGMGVCGCGQAFVSYFFLDRS